MSAQRNHAFDTVNPRELVPGRTYAFFVRKPGGKDSAGVSVETRLRDYLGFYVMGGVPFLEVKPAGGRRHLLPCAEIAGLAPC
jgi:hypothetical protein